MILISESFFLFFRKNPRQCRVKRSYCKRSRCIISMKTRFSRWSTGEFNDRWKRAACPLSPQDTKGMIPFFSLPSFLSPRTFPFDERTASKKRTRPQASFIPLCVLLFLPPFVYFPYFSTSIPALRFHHLTPAIFALPQHVFFCISTLHRYVNTLLIVMELWKKGIIGE